jgi:hypothetical protein
MSPWVPQNAGQSILLAWTEIGQEQRSAIEADAYRATLSRRRSHKGTQAKRVPVARVSNLRRLRVEPPGPATFGRPRCQVPRLSVRQVADRHSTTDTVVMASKPSPAHTDHGAGNTRPLYRPHPKDEAEIRRAFEEAERGEVLDAATSEAYLRWLETGEGPCPWTESQD